jgi:uncharacterized protein YicC (UPF0701 family)
MENLMHKPKRMDAKTRNRLDGHVKQLEKFLADGGWNRNLPKRMDAQTCNRLDSHVNQLEKFLADGGWNR